jgi:dolichyl-phosphate beta-glucosyltransferase
MFHKPSNFRIDAASVQTAECAIVIPCYNEENRFNSRAFLHFVKRALNVHLVFVDDGSKDKTLEILTMLKCIAGLNITVLSLSKNAGKAEAVRQGLIYASQRGFTFLGYWDADLATPLDAIEDFVKVGRKLDTVDVVFGSRRSLLGHRIQRSVARRAVSRTCALLARQAVRLPIGDTQCGAKLLRNTQAVRDALAHPFTAGWLFDVELFARISSKVAEPSYAFYELPLLEWEEVAGSKVTGTTIVKSGFRMLRLIAEMRLGLPKFERAEKFSVTLKEIETRSDRTLQPAA